jgi:hypothetical protein
VLGAAAVASGVLLPAPPAAAVAPSILSRRPLTVRGDFSDGDGATGAAADAAADEGLPKMSAFSPALEKGSSVP